MGSLWWNMHSVKAVAAATTEIWKISSPKYYRVLSKTETCYIVLHVPSSVDIASVQVAFGWQ